MKIRNLTNNDLRNAANLLDKLSIVGNITDSDLKTQFQRMLINPYYYTYVAEENKQLIGIATLFIELKFTHQCGMVGHIEDVVVDEAFRHKEVGSKLIERLVDTARQEGCYKVILNCKPELCPFYGKNGFRNSHNIEMRLDITNTN